MTKSRWDYDGLHGLKFFDRNGVELDFGDLDEVEDDDVDKASFGGDRSAAGRYAAQMRWRNRQALTSDSTGSNMGSEGGGMETGHGLKTDLPVMRTPSGALLVQQENGGWRAPTAGERGLPTAADVKRQLEPELAELKAMSGGEKVKMLRDVQTMLSSLTSFQRSFDANGGSFEQTTGIGWETRRKARRFNANTELFPQRYGTWDTMTMSYDPQIVSVADRIFAKIKPIAEQVLALERPAT